MAKNYVDKAGLLYVVTKIRTLLSGKVDKVDGMGLSESNFTAAEKTKLGGVATGANNYTHPVYTSKISGLYKIVVDALGHVSGTTAVTKTDITGLGIPGQDTTYSAATSSETGLMSADDKAKLDGVASGATKTVVDSAMSSTSTNPVQNRVVNSALGAKAPIASPTFTGTPKAPTATAGTNTTQVATTAFVTSAVSTAVADITSFGFEVVTSLPTTGSKGIIYLLSNGGTGNNVYDEYIYVNNSFEKIGTTAVDLSGYVLSSDLVAVTTTEIDAMFS